MLGLVSRWSSAAAVESSSFSDVFVLKMHPNYCSKHKEFIEEHKKSICSRLGKISFSEKVKLHRRVKFSVVVWGFFLCFSFFN